MCVFIFSILPSAFCILHSGLGNPIPASASFLAMVTCGCDQIQLKRIKGVSPHAVVARLAHHEVRASKHTWAEITVGITDRLRLRLRLRLCLCLGLGLEMGEGRNAKCPCATAIIPSQLQQYPIIRLPLRWATHWCHPHRCQLSACHIIYHRIRGR